MNIKEMTEDEIIVKYDRLAKKLAGKIYKLKKDLLDTRFMDFDDLVQLAYIGIFDAIRSFSEEGGANFTSYAWICVQNRINRDAFRPKTVKAYMKFGDFSLDSVVGDEEEGTTLLALTGEEDINIEDTVFKDIQLRLLNRLSKEDKQMLVMYNIEGKTLREIAEVYNVSHQLIRQKLGYITEQLKVQYMRECKKYA